MYHLVINKDWIVKERKEREAEEKRKRRKRRKWNRNSKRLKKIPTSCNYLIVNIGWIVVIIIAVWVISISIITTVSKLILVIKSTLLINASLTLIDLPCLRLHELHPNAIVIELLVLESDGLLTAFCNNHCSIIYML
jgi:ABC-type multidrug transport system fused ATPase/permease subunit